MYIVLTGDLKSSKKMGDRFLVQENLRNALNTVNDNFHENIVANFRIVGGDGFQGMISGPDFIFDIYFVLFEKINRPFYLGIGIENISTSLSRNVEEMDGKAFHLSSEALKIAKKKKRWVVLKSNLENNDLFACILNFVSEFMWSWTQKRKEIILFYKKNGEDSSAIEKASIKFDTVERNVYKNIEVGRYTLIKSAADVFQRELLKEWSKI